MKYLRIRRKMGITGWKCSTKADIFVLLSHYKRVFLWILQYFAYLCRITIISYGEIGAFAKPIPLTNLCLQIPKDKIVRLVYYARV